MAHSAFAILTVSAQGYWSLYVGSLMGGLAAGAIEAAINPIVATIYRTDKTKWLNILHAGWPAGMVIAGLISITAGDSLDWRGQVGLIFIPVVLYGLMMAMCAGRFPVNERVAAGVSHRQMLKEVGFLSALVASTLILLELGRVFEFPTVLTWSLVGVVSIGYGLYSGSFGRPLFFALVLIMVPLAITELGTDSWITDLMRSEMAAIEINPLWVLVYTTCIMMVLRFTAGPIVHKLSPLGLLAVSSGLAICGLLFLSQAVGIAVFAAATVYGLGKTFFWPTMLGVVSEQCPKGGALTLNLISGVGMMAAGVIGSQLLGYIQDTEVNADLLAARPALHAQLMGEQKHSIFGDYVPLDEDRLQAASEADREVVAEIELRATKDTLTTNAIFPGIMLVAYLLLILWFRSRGGYRPVELPQDGT